MSDAITSRGHEGSKGSHKPSIREPFFQLWVCRDDAKALKPPENPKQSAKQKKTFVMVTHFLRINPEIMKGGGVKS